MENIFTSARPFCLLSKILGLFPVSFDGPAANGVLKLSFFGVVCSGLSAFIAISLIALNLLQENIPTSSSRLLSLLFRIDLLIGLLLNLITLFYQMGRLRSIANFLIAIHNIDEKVNDKNKISLSLL